MTSILTNTSAMIALQTLKGINNNLMKTQEEISTGKSVGSAKDNAAVWAISKVMEADVQGFKGISDSLSLGSATVAVARQATETVTTLLTNIKGKIVAAQESNVDRAKIQTDIAAMREQIATVTNSAQFNGLNLIKGTESVDVLSSLDRSSDGSVSASSIAVSRQDMTTTAGVFNSLGTNLDPNVTGSAVTVASAAQTAEITFVGTVATDTATITVAGIALNFTAPVGVTVTSTADFFTGAINALGLEGVSASNVAGVLTISSTRAFEGLNVQAADTGTGTALITAVNGAAPDGVINTATDSDINQRAETLAFSTTAAVNDGDGYKVTIGTASYDYIAGKNETMEDVAKGLKAAIDSAGVDGITTKVTQDATTKQWSLSVDNDGTNATLTTSATFGAIGRAGGTASGGLFGLDGIDVTTSAGAKSALSNIETMIQSAIDGSAAFGSVEGRIKTQSAFVSKLSDALKSGIGSMVDADMEEVSARLQALQVQQQLGVQALSIANQSPQSIMALFR